MGKNKKNRQKQQKSPQPSHQIPIITATSNIDNEEESDQVEQVTIQTPDILVETVSFCKLSIIFLSIFSLLKVKMDIKRKKKIALNKSWKK